MFADGDQGDGGIGAQWGHVLRFLIEVTVVAGRTGGAATEKYTHPYSLKTLAEAFALIALPVTLKRRKNRGAHSACRPCWSAGRTSRHVDPWATSDKEP